MSHSSHSYEFFSKSLFSPPVVVTISCVTFDALSRLTPADADLCFATKCCFICRIANHHVDACPQHCLGMLLCKRLENVHRELFVGFGWLVIDSITGWDALGRVLDAIIQQEFAPETMWRQWGHQVSNEDGWGVSDEQEVSVEVRSRLKDSKGSSACRCRLLSSIDLN
jgi:hypothetical protein